MAKAITFILKNDLQQAAGGLQLCVGLPGGAEAGIHGMWEVFESDDNEGLIQVDANNAFNTTNKNALHHNIEVLCLDIASFVWNCYGRPAWLFVAGGLEIFSEEETTITDR